VNEARFGMPEILSLYAHPAFPLKKRAVSKVVEHAA
jgi:hypothetical protein